MSVSGKITAYNTGFQIEKNNVTSIEKTGTMTVIYPKPVELTGELMDEILVREDDAYEVFVKVTCSVIVSGNYYNFSVDGATAASGSFYGLTNDQKELLKDGETVTMYGYLNSISKSSGAPKYVNIIPTHIEDTPMTVGRISSLTRAAATVEDKYAVYKYNGTAFEPADMTVVQPADYAAMGHGNGFASDSSDEATLLPKYLKAKYPYASVDEVVYVSYRKGGVWTTDEYTFDGSDWNKTEYTVTANSRFRKMNDGKWSFDSTYEIDFTTIGQADLKEFQQYCANWVYDNIDVKLGAPERDNAGDILSTASITVAGASPAGSFFVSNYGNNEWYAGTYAYYGEMNWDASKAEGSFMAAAKAIDLDPSIDVDLGMDVNSLVNETFDRIDIVKAMQKNAAKVFKHVLEAMYPDFTPEDYSAIVVNIVNYYEREEHNLKKAAYTYTFNVVGTGVFEFDEESFGLAE